MKDYYAILGIAPSAEEIVIRAAWKALAQRYHPDRFAGDIAQTHARMAEINEAYNVLSSPVQREAYDQKMANQPSAAGEGKRDTKTDQAENDADEFEKNWVAAVGRQSNFANNPEIIAFARQLMFEGNKAAAEALDNSIRELSSEVPAEWIINRICEDFNVETKEMWKRRQQREAKAREDAVWEKVRKKARTEAARKMDAVVPESASPNHAPTPLGPAGISTWHWRGSFLTATVIVVIFAGIAIWIFS